MQELNKTRAVKILRIVMPIVGLIIFVLTAPWAAIAVWVQPLPDTVQEQLYEAIEHDLDGIRLLCVVAEGHERARLHRAANCVYGGTRLS